MERVPEVVRVRLVVGLLAACCLSAAAVSAARDSGYKDRIIKSLCPFPGVGRITGYPPWFDSCGLNNMIPLPNLGTLIDRLSADNGQSRRDRRSATVPTSGWLPWLDASQGESGFIANRLARSVPETQLQPYEKMVNEKLAADLVEMNFTLVLLTNKIKRVDERFSELYIEYSNKIKPWEQRDPANHFRAWFPTFNNLTYRQEPNQEVSAETSTPDVGQYLRNITHYLEYFQCAFEQMVFEEMEAPSSSEMCNILDNMASDLLQVQCYTDQLISIFETTLNHLRKINRDRWDVFPANTSISLALARLKSLAGVSHLFKSPLVERDGRPDVLPSSLHVYRDFMPQENRELSFCCRHERNVSILKDLKQFLVYYNSVLAIVYPAHAGRAKLARRDTTERLLSKLIEQTY